MKYIRPFENECSRSRYRRLFLRFSCPYCKAKSGAYCRTKRGKRFWRASTIKYYNDSHMARKMLVPVVNDIDFKVEKIVMSTREFFQYIEGGYTKSMQKRWSELRKMK